MSLALASVLLFIIIYVATSLVTGFNLWPSGVDNFIDVIVPLGLGGLALAAGLLLGLILSRLISAPLKHFASNLRERGLAAIEGRPADDTVSPIANVPLELKELDDTVEQLLRQLSLHQADLHAATERALVSEQTFRTVVNASSEVKLLMRGDVIEVANPAAVTFLGQPLDSLLGRPLFETLSTFTITTEADEPLSAEMLLSRGSDALMLVRCLAENGEERWAECTVTHPQDDSGLSLLTIRDVTERRTLEQLRAEVVLVVSHDLRAPLTVVSGYLEMLAGDMPDERRTDIVSRARAATSGMAEMLEDLLDTARGEKGLLSTRWAPVSLSKLAAEVASSLPSHAGHELVFEQHADVSVPGDAGRLRQALTNLLMNAIKHTPEGTTISLQVDASPQHALLIVEDTGGGVAEKHRERIFERYTRLDGGSSDGAGLGLYIVRTVAEGHGGDVHVEDGSSGGARFVIRLPLLPPEAS
ncbi:MAG: PAS domain-containing sensor histidine kinase [Coriobacteriia bacterium]|nr:PAS domain-containing sensor histidine kinase [Coriobacteriia bacterium]